MSSVHATGFEDRVGVIDLSWWDPQDGPVSLDGTWEFFWDQLLEPKDFETANEPDYPIALKLPGSWKGMSDGHHVLPGLGYGTLRLRVLLPEGRLRNNPPLSLYVRDVRSGYQLWVNGELLASERFADDEFRAPKTASKPVQIDIDSRSSHLDIVLHVVNFSFREGGLGKSVFLGTRNQILNHAKQSLVLCVFLVSSLWIVGVYHIGLWTVRRHHIHVLYFGLICLVMALRTSVLEEVPLLYVFPGLSWETQLKLEYLGFYFGVPLFLLFARSLYPKEFNRMIVMAFSVVSGLFSLGVLLTPARYYSEGLIYFEGVAILAFIVTAYGLGTAALRKRRGAGTILFGATVVMLIVVHDMFFFWRLWGTRALAPLAILFMVVSYSLVLSKQLADELEEQRRLTQDNSALLNTVRQQMNEIKKTRRLLHERDERIRQDVAEMLHGAVQSRLLSIRHHIRMSISHLISLSGRGKDWSRELEPSIVRLDKASAQIETVTRDEIRKISHLLHPMSLSIGLTAALYSLTERFKEHLDVEFIADESMSELERENSKGTIPASTGLAVYRIVEEAMTNVLKHAGATKADVQLMIQRDPDFFLEVIVRDNGVGIKGNSSGTGLGLKMIAARVEEMGGAWQLQNESGGGTRLYVRLPLDPDAVSGQDSVKNDDQGFRGA